MHDKKIEDIFEELDTRKEGLTGEEAKERLEKYGFNELHDVRTISPLKIFLN